MNKLLVQAILMAIACSALSAQDVSNTYAAHCANCHGADGAGKTPLGKTLKLRNLRSSEVKKLSADELALIIGRGMGRGRMPRFEKKLGTDMVVQLAAYVQNLDRQPALPQVRPAKAQAQSEPVEAKDVYAVKCAHCHGADGSGQSILGRRLKLRDLRAPEVRQYSESRLVAIIATGTDQGRMPGFQKKLGPEMVEQLASYVRTLSGGAPIIATKTAIRSESDGGPGLPDPVETAAAVEDRTSKAQPEIKPREETPPANRQSALGKLSAIIPGTRSGPKAELVDLNSASKELLMTLPGITEADAANIIGARPYKSSLQFKTRRIVAPETYARIADRVIAKQPGRGTTQRSPAENAAQDTVGASGFQWAIPARDDVVKY